MMGDKQIFKKIFLFQCLRDIWIKKSLFPVMQACSCLRQRKAAGNSIHCHYQLLSCISKTGTKTIKHKNLTLVHTMTVTSEDSGKSQLLFGLHITEMTLSGGVLAVLKIKNGYRQCCFVIYVLKILKSLILYEKCFNFGSKDQHYKIEGLDLIS